MIGVIAVEAEQDVVREFFELFKTPWEFFHDGGQYDVVLCTGDREVKGAAKLIVHYAARKTRSDDICHVRVAGEYKAPRFLASNAYRIPIYGDSCTYVGGDAVLLKDEESQECASYTGTAGETCLVRIGYDLFGEVRELLTVGQPKENANIPTLELHIAFLREVILEQGISLVEIPPIPEGYQFIACLTHDVDHPSICLHKWDHTAFGFLYRATLGSLRKFLGRQISFNKLLMNWVAALKLPLAYLGLAKDFWRDFPDRYKSLENDCPSTFFVIPFKRRPGVAPRGSAPSFRASGYGARDIADIIQGLQSAGNEVGLHGIDAWSDSVKGREELDEIRSLTGAGEAGVRMHWLYFDRNSHEALEKAGADYDSTVGYNEAVGYRAGTTQVYKPFTTKHLLELPLHVMDTALFYPSRLELSPKQAAAVLDQMENNTIRFGGVLTVNWHDRSLAPERQWDASYRQLLADLKSRGAWFATAGQVVAWFRKRRAARFEMDSRDPDVVHALAASGQDSDLPDLRLRTQCMKPTTEGLGLQGLTVEEIRIGNEKCGARLCGHRTQGTRCICR